MREGGASAAGASASFVDVDANVDVNVDRVVLTSCTLSDAPLDNAALLALCLSPSFLERLFVPRLFFVCDCTCTWRGVVERLDLLGRCAGISSDGDIGSGDEFVKGKESSDGPNNDEDEDASSSSLSSLLIFNAIATSRSESSIPPLRPNRLALLKLRMDQTRLCNVAYTTVGRQVCSYRSVWRNGSHRNYRYEYCTETLVPNAKRRTPSYYSSTYSSFGKLAVTHLHSTEERAQAPNLTCSAGKKSIRLQSNK